MTCADTECCAFYFLGAKASLSLHLLFVFESLAPLIGSLSAPLSGVTFTCFKFLPVLICPPFLVYRYTDYHHPSFVAHFSFSLGYRALESRKLHRAELNYGVREKNFFWVVIFALKKWGHYLFGKPVVLYADPHSRQYLLTQKTLIGRVARWMHVFAEYSWKIQYVQGPKNVVADCSRRKEMDTPPGILQTLTDTCDFLRLNRLIWTST